MSRVHGPTLRCLVLALCASSLACASVPRGDAARLASAGARTALASRAFVLETQVGIERTVEASYLIAPLTGREPPGDAMLSSVARIESAVRARAEVLRSLGELYAAFGELAAFDAEAEVATALSNLSGAAGAYRGAVDPQGDPIPASATSLVTRTGGLFARALDLAAEVARLAGVLVKL